MLGFDALLGACDSAAQEVRPAAAEACRKSRRLNRTDIARKYSEL
jgi:hypothetical protein